MLSIGGLSGTGTTLGPTRLIMSDGASSVLIGDWKSRPLSSYVMSVSNRLYGRPSVRIHACSAASAISKIETGALGYPLRWASAEQGGADGRDPGARQNRQRKPFGPCAAAVHIRPTAAVLRYHGRFESAWCAGRERRAGRYRVPRQGTHRPRVCRAGTPPRLEPSRRAQPR